MPTPIPSSTASTAPTSSSEIITAQQRAREAGLIRNEKEAAYKEVIKASGTDGNDAKNAKNELLKAQVELESRQSELRVLLKGGAPDKSTVVDVIQPAPKPATQFVRIQSTTRKLFTPELTEELKKLLKNKNEASELLHQTSSLVLLIKEPTSKAAFFESLRVYTNAEHSRLPVGVHEKAAREIHLNEARPLAPKNGD